MSVAERGALQTPALPAGFSLSLCRSLRPEIWRCVCKRERGLFLVQSPLMARKHSSASPVILIFSKPTLSDKYNLYSFFFWTIRVLYSKYVSCRQHIIALKKNSAWHFLPFNCLVRFPFRWFFIWLVSSPPFWFFVFYLCGVFFFFWLC